MSGHWSEAPSCRECYDDKRNHVRVCAVTEVGYCPNDKRFTDAELAMVWRSIAEGERGQYMNYCRCCGQRYDTRIGEDWQEWLNPYVYCDRCRRRDSTTEPCPWCGTQKAGPAPTEP